MFHDGQVPTCPRGCRPPEGTEQGPALGARVCEACGRGFVVVEVGRFAVYYPGREHAPDHSRGLQARTNEAGLAPLPCGHHQLVDQAGWQQCRVCEGAIVAVDEGGPAAVSLIGKAYEKAFALLVDEGTRRADVEMLVPAVVLQAGELVHYQGIFLMGRPELRAEYASPALASVERARLVMAELKRVIDTVEQLALKAQGQGSPPPN